MKRLPMKLSLVFCTALLLSACNNSDDNNTSDTGRALQQFSANSGDSKEIMNPDGLEQDLSNLFGKADAEPVAVNAQDNVQAIIDRAKAK